MKKLRECLPNKERERYVQLQREKGKTEISVRIDNRYIDEFVRWSEAELGHTKVENVKEGDLVRYGEEVRKSILSARVFHPDKKGYSRITLSTARTKVSCVLKWFHWMHAEGRLKSDPGKALTAAKLLPEK